MPAQIEALFSEIWAKMNLTQDLKSEVLDLFCQTFTYVVQNFTEREIFESEIEIKK